MALSLTLKFVILLTGVGLAHGDQGLTGATGFTGPRGFTGPTGPTGSTGATGAQGKRGEPGALGPAGPTGPKGDQGYKGDRGERGPNGYDGHPGERGPMGSTGRMGPIGVPGPMGPRGSPGPQGPSGPSGPQGSAGTRGEPGVPGRTGKTGATGMQGPPGHDGGKNGATGATGQPGPPGNLIDDIDECNSTIHKCEHICINTVGSYMCDCYEGYKLDESMEKCEDVDECLYSNGHCQHTCTNFMGGFECSCYEGYTLEKNEFMCSKDSIDENLPIWLLAVIMIFGFLILVLLISNCVMIGVLKRLRKSHKLHKRSTRSTASLPSFTEGRSKGSMSSSITSAPWTHNFSTTSRTQALPTIPQDEAMLARQSSYSGYMQPMIVNAAPYENGAVSRVSEASPIYLELAPEASGYQGLQSSNAAPGNKYEKVQNTDNSDNKPKGKVMDSTDNLAGVENSEIFADDPEKARELEGDNNSQKKLIATDQKEPRYQKVK